MGKLIWGTVITVLPPGNLHMCVSTEENSEITASGIKSSLKTECLINELIMNPKHVVIRGT